MMNRKLIKNKNQENMNTYDFIVDLSCSAGILLFTGADIATSSDISVIEIVTNLGVIGVLLLWLWDTKKQLKTQLSTFDKETDEIRKHYDKMVQDLIKSYKEDRERLLEEIASKQKIIEELLISKVNESEQGSN